MPVRPEGGTSPTTARVTPGQWSSLKNVDEMLKNVITNLKISRFSLQNFRKPVDSRVRLGKYSKFKKILDWIGEKSTGWASSER